MQSKAISMTNTIYEPMDVSIVEPLNETTDPRKYILLFIVEMLLWIVLVRIDVVKSMIFCVPMLVITFIVVLYQISAEEKSLKQI
jgi:hypothetical protein